jgi:hypothetical protein
MQLNLSAKTTVLALLLLAAAATPAQAYMGPGLGFGAFGTALGVVGALLLGLISILWYPLKRLYRRMRGIASPTRGVRPATIVRREDDRR